MSSYLLNHSVAQTTGESLRTIRKIGFGLHDPTVLESEDIHLAIDCPFCGRACLLPSGPDGLPAMAECDPCDVYFGFHFDEVYAAGPASIPA
jgi:hypothetical protein